MADWPGPAQVITEIDNGKQENGDGFGLIVHTSGTTGVPQPIALSLAQIQANSDAVTSVIEPGRWLCPLPLSHIGGLMVLLRSWLTRTTAVLGPADTEDVTVASLVPTQLARLIHQPPPAALQCVMLGGAPADPTLLVRARDSRLARAPVLRAHPGVQRGHPGRRGGRLVLGPPAARAFP